MLDALAALPAPGLLVLLALVFVAGWAASHGWDAIVDGWYRATGRARVAGRAAWRSLLRLLFGLGVLAGALTVIGLAYAKTH
jgi:hypothetical protein